MSGLVDYGDSDSSGDESSSGSQILTTMTTTTVASSSSAINTAPQIMAKPGSSLVYHVDPQAKEVSYNPKAEQLFAPQAGPLNIFKQNKTALKRNTFTGYIEEGHISDFQFDNQRYSYNNLGFAMDPSQEGDVQIGDANAMKKFKGMSNVHAYNTKNKKKKRKNKGDPEDIEDYKGPWADFEEDIRVAQPSEEQMEVLEKWAKEREEKKKHRRKRGPQTEEEKIKRMKETTTLHIKDPVDYQGRSFLHPPQTEGVTYKTPEQCYLPKKCIHTWTGHKNGVTAIRFFPNSAHLLLSCGNDKKIKLWEFYGKRRLIRTYEGHSEAVRDIAFNLDGSQFVSCGYDRYARLWNTESGECLRRFTNQSVIYCVKFHPAPDKQNLFCAGTQNKRIMTWDTTTGDVVQEYDRHLGAVNSISFVEGGRRMVTTSDDKSIRVWEWDIPVDIKYISDPAMHSMPRVALHPQKPYMCLQSMDNKIITYTANDKFKEQRKTFRGHQVAGYACNLCFSPDGSYLVSGDGRGYVHIWKWETSRKLESFKAHDKACVDVQWNPNSTSKLVTASWDGSIKLWD
eukprot:m.37989 g.37989  ORF g.37989 m.37989 type:complete len:567 (-) comp6771_c0_seq3:2117-3817(-)